MSKIRDKRLSRRTPKVTWNANQIERVGTAIEVRDPNEGKKSREQHPQVHRLVRSVPWNMRVATRHIPSEIAQSYRVSNPDASNFGRWISGVGNQQHGMQASGVAVAEFTRRDSRALDVAACGPVRSPATTNAEGHLECEPNRKSWNRD